MKPEHITLLLRLVSEHKVETMHTLANLHSMYRDKEELRATGRYKSLANDLVWCEQIIEDLTEKVC